MTFFNTVTNSVLSLRNKLLGVDKNKSKTYTTYTAPKKPANKSTNNYSIGLMRTNGLNTINQKQSNSGITATLGVAKPISQQKAPYAPPKNIVNKAASDGQAAPSGGNSDFSDSGQVGYDIPTSEYADFSGFQTPQISPEIQAQMDKFNLLQSGLSNDELSSLQSKANSDAKAQNAEQRAYYDKLLGELGTAKTDQLGILNNDLNRAISSSQEQAFLNSLKAQQDSASRGMTGQAISVDAALRNNMESQRAMGETYAKSDENIKSLIDGYNKNVSDINGEKGKLIDSVTAQKLFDTYKNNALADKSEQSKSILDYIKAVAPYAMPTANNVLDNYTKTSISNSELDMKRQELSANVSKWQNDSQLKAADLSLGWAQLDNKVNETNAKIQDMENSMVNQSLKMEFQSTKAALDNVTSLLKNTKDESQQKILTQYYNQLVNKLGTTYASDASTP